MSVVQLDAEISIACVVEAMLPRFSDGNLGLLIPLLSLGHLMKITANNGQ